MTTRSIGRDDRGASAVEYGLIVFAIAALISVAVFSFGGAVHDLFQTSCNTMSAKTNSTTC